MGVIRVTKAFDFEMAHALWNYDGACKNIHGHSYKLLVTVGGEPNPDENDPKFGMVIDFTDLKLLIKESVINQLDHALLVYKKAEGESLTALKKMYEKVHVLDFQPTCENLVIHIVGIIKKLLPRNNSLLSVKLFETATSFAEWYAGDDK